MGWIAVDLDGTLAEWGEGTSNPCDVCLIGKPIPQMVERVRAWLAEGKDVRIFTARVGPATDEECWNNSGNRCPSLWDWQEWQTQMIRAWCTEHLGQPLPITCTKDWHMWQLWDDRCVQMIPNTGECVQERALEDFGEAICGLALALGLRRAQDEVEGAPDPAPESPL